MIIRTRIINFLFKVVVLMLRLSIYKAIIMRLLFRNKANTAVKIGVQRIRITTNLTVYLETINVCTVCSTLY